MVITSALRVIASREYICPISDHGFSPFLANTTIRNTSSPTEMAAGTAKLRLMLPHDVLRQASSGPTAVKKVKSRPIGIVTLLKNGAPTVIL